MQPRILGTPRFLNLNPSICFPKETSPLASLSHIFAEHDFRINRLRYEAARWMYRLHKNRKEVQPTSTHSFLAEEYIIYMIYNLKR